MVVWFGASYLLACAFHAVSSAVRIDILGLMKSNGYGLYVDGCVRR